LSGGGGAGAGAAAAAAAAQSLNSAQGDENLCSSPAKNSSIFSKLCQN
jgi:hypothetical protein